MQIHKELDARGLTCPLPILKAKKALSEMHSGEILQVLATDPGSVRDFQAFSRQTGNDLVEQRTQPAGWPGAAPAEGGEEFVHLLRRR
jgi:tRNA 2-thiouridine synthesizing protein A